VSAHEKLIKLSGIIFLFALMVSSPVASRAQSAVEWFSWDGPDQNTEPETKSPPLDLNGCWEGTEQDQGGEGTLWINFVQNGRKLTRSTTGAISFSNGQRGSGHLSGSANATKFHVGHISPGCNVTFHGAPASDGDLVGRFNFNCPRSGIHTHFKGTFDLASDPDGCK